MIKSNIKTYKSGLRVLVRPMEQTRAVSVGIFVGTGSVMETESERGISHFIEHMLFKGTKKRSAFDIAEQMECLGVQINAYTAKNITVYYTGSTDEHTEACAELLSDLYFNSTFLKENIKKEQGVVIEEIGMCEDDPEDLCFELASQAHYGDGALAQPILGTKKSVKSFNKKKIAEYMAKHYTPENTVVVFAGHLTEAEGYSLAERYFERNMKPASCLCAEPDRQEPECKFVKKFKNIEQANVVFSFPSSTYYTKKSDATAYLHLILGGGMSSRLFQRVREEDGLAYSIYSMPMEYRNDGYFAIYLGTSPMYLERAVRAVREVVLELKDKGFSEKEFLKAREQLKSALVLGGESASSLMRASGKLAVLRNEVFQFDQRLNRINAVTPDDVKAVMDEILDFDRVSAAYVGKKSVIDVLKIVRGE